MYFLINHCALAKSVLVARLACGGQALLPCLLFLLVLLGATWCFHIIWTVWMIPKDQPDLKEHGTFFSLMIIILANLILLTILLCVTQDYLTMKDFAWNWWNNILDLSEAFGRLLFF